MAKGVAKFNHDIPTCVHMPGMAARFCDYLSLLADFLFQSHGFVPALLQSMFSLCLSTARRLIMR